MPCVNSVPSACLVRVDSLIQQCDEVVEPTLLYDVENFYLSLYLLFQYHSLLLTYKRERMRACVRAANWMSRRPPSVAKVREGVRK